MPVTCFSRRLFNQTFFFIISGYECLASHTVSQTPQWGLPQPPWSSWTLFTPMPGERAMQFGPASQFWVLSTLSAVENTPTNQEQDSECKLGPADRLREDERYARSVLFDKPFNDATTAPRTAAICIFVYLIAVCTGSQGALKGVTHCGLSANGFVLFSTFT